MMHHRAPTVRTRPATRSPPGRAELAEVVDEIRDRLVAQHAGPSCHRRAGEAPRDEGEGVGVVVEEDVQGEVVGRR